MTMCWAIVLVGVGSYALRLIPLLLGERLRLSERADAALRHASIGAMTALLVLGAQRAATDPASVARIALGAALATSAAVAFVGRSMPVVVLTGAATYGLTLVLVSRLLA